MERRPKIGKARSAPSRDVASYVSTARLFMGTYVYAGLGTMQGVECAIDVYRYVATGQALFGAFFGLPGAFDVNLGGSFSRLGKNCDLVRQDFCKSPRHRKPLFRGALAVDDLADGELRDQR